VYTKHKAIGVKQAWSIKNYRYVCNVSDPFYMDEVLRGALGNRMIVSKYIENFMIDNKDKDCFLMPYFPE
jgi:hypothetical protein